MKATEVQPTSTEKRRRCQAAQPRRNPRTNRRQTRMAETISVPETVSDVSNVSDVSDGIRCIGYIRRFSIKQFEKLYAARFDIPQRILFCIRSVRCVHCRAVE